MQNSTFTASNGQRQTAVEQPTDQDDQQQSNHQQPPSIETIEKTLTNLKQDHLEPIAPREAIDLYLNDRREELRESTLKTHRSALRFFANWCDQQSIENLNTLNGRDLHRYRIWRRDTATVKVDTLSKESERTQQKIIRQFIRYCETIEAVALGLHNKVRVPTVSKDEATRSEVLESDRVSDILDWLRQFRYATLEHVVWELLANTGVRIGTLVSLDIEDYRPDADPPHLDINHRSGTPLKNGPDGERLIALQTDVCEVVDDYLNERRPDVSEPGDRKPLLATDIGRVAQSTIRTYVYRWSRPCAIGEECPHDSDPDECKATETHKEAKCPSSRSPHALRRGYISHELASGVERSLIGGKCNVSESIIEAHYDARNEEERMEVRLQALKAARQTSQRYGGD